MLEVQIQQDFSGGAHQGPSRELIPANGVYRILNGLLEQDGSIFRRGGSTLKANLAPVMGAAPLTLLWDGLLQGGQRTVFGGGAVLGVLAADDVTPLVVSSVAIAPLRPAAGNGILVVPQVNGDLRFYAGSRKPNYATGTITTTLGSRVVTGVGTAWLANVDAGAFMFSGTDHIGLVESVQSNTSLTLRENAYKVVAGVGHETFMFFIADLNDTGGPLIAVAAVGNPPRIVWAVNSRIKFSYPGSSALENNATDYHQLPHGAEVLGMESLRNVLFVFSTAGIFTISGMDYDLTDAAGNVQHRLDQINRDVILWDQRGIAGWGGSLVVPGTDDVYLISDSAAPRAISEPIRKLYRDYVASGHQCGGATVYRNHYFLPIVNEGVWVDTLVCRLDGGGWAQWFGTAAQSVWMTTRGSSTTTRGPMLLSAFSMILNDLSGTFTPAATNKNDQTTTGTADFPFEVVTRDYTTAGLRQNLVKKVRIGYELTAAAGDSPVVSGEYAVGATAPFVVLEGSGPVSDGAATYAYPVGTVRPRFIRFRFATTAPCARLVLKSVELLTRAGGRQ